MKHVVRKKVFRQQEKNLIQADLNLAMPRHAVLPAVARFRAEIQKAGLRKVPTTIGVAESSLAKRKAILREGKHPIQADPLPMTGQKETPIAIGVVVKPAKENLSVNPVSKVAKDRLIENSVVVHQKMLNLNHFVNLLIHRTINLHLKQIG